MNEDVGLRADILEHPQDDTPRLIYADWLDDRAGPGDPARAAFIRLQIELARGGPPDLARREKSMLAQNARLWSRGLRPALSRLSWRRGFVEAASVLASAFLDAPDEVMALAPLRQLRFRDPAGHMTSLCRCPHLARLEGVSFSQGRLSRDDLTALSCSPHLDALRELDLGGNAIGWCGRLRAVLERLPGLDSLGLAGYGLGGGLFWVIPHLPGRLVSLDLEANGLDDGCLALLGHYGDASRLRRLAIGRNRFTADGLNRLLEAMPNLESLAVGRQPRGVREQLTKDYTGVAFQFGHAAGMGA